MRKDKKSKRSDGTSEDTGSSIMPLYTYINYKCLTRDHCTPAARERSETSYEVFTRRNISLEGEPGM